MSLITKGLFSFLLLFSIQSQAAVSLYELYPNIHTVGIMVVFDTPVPDSTTSEVYYEEKINGYWGPVKQGLELSRVTGLQYSGCVFYTKPNTEYRVRTMVKDGSNTLMDETKIIVTRNNPEPVVPLRTYYVSPDGTGISQNVNNPGALNQALLDILVAGDKVALLSGTYHTGELTIKNSGTLQNPIQFEGMDSVVMDGSFPSVTWQRKSSDSLNRDFNMFYANLGSINTNCVVVDGKRLYPYRNLLELSTFQSIRAIDGNGFTSGNYSFDLDGFFRDGRNPSGNYAPYVGFNPNTYIKFIDGSDTTGKDIRVSRFTHCFSATGQSNIRFNNITFKYFGAAKSFGAKSALYFQDCDSLLIEHCNFEFCDRGIFFRGDADDNVIQQCQFTDDLGGWSYLQFKDTNVDYGQLNVNYPNYCPNNSRNVEPGKIYFDRNFTGRGNIIRNNTFTGSCDGISCPSFSGDSTTSRHFDIYENEFGYGSDDAFEVDGNASNIRVWGNVVHHIAGISAASPCYGPVYVFRNTFYDLKMGEYSYIYFDITGYHLYHEYVPGSPLKLNAAYCDIPGVVYFLHNTVDGGPDAKGFYVQQPQAQSSWANVISRNNIIYNESNEHTLWVRATDKVDFDYNNYYCTQTFTARQDRPGYGVYNSVSEVAQNILGDLNVPGSFIEKHSYQIDPSQGWVDENAHDYHLLPSSNMLDKGIFIPGINGNYLGAAPDLGAFELIVADTITTAYISIAPVHFTVYPNPGKGTFILAGDDAHLNDAVISINEVSGREIYRAPVMSNPQTITLEENVVSGTYVFQVISKTQLERKLLVLMR